MKHPPHPCCPSVLQAAFSPSCGPVYVSSKGDGSMSGCCRKGSGPREKAAMTQASPVLPPAMRPNENSLDLTESS